MRAVALCGSDLHITEGHTPTTFTPIVLGHEIAGVVARIDDGADHRAIAGDHVFVNPMVGCLTCRFCRAGQANLCSRRKILGIQLDGAPAEYVVAAGRPDGLDGVVDCVGFGATFTTALRLLRINGHCAVVGIGAEPLMLTAPAHFTRRALRVSGVYGYTAADIAEVASRLIDGSLDLRASISAVLPLDQVDEGLRMFADRENSPVRVVVEP